VSARALDSFRGRCLECVRKFVGAMLQICRRYHLPELA
jgi:hypothetical protein